MLVWLPYSLAWTRGVIDLPFTKYLLCPSCGPGIAVDLEDSVEIGIIPVAAGVITTNMLSRAYHVQGTVLSVLHRKKFFHHYNSTKYVIILWMRKLQLREVN